MSSDRISPPAAPGTSPVIFLLDVDGVLNPFGWGFDPTTAMPGYTSHELDGYMVRLNPSIGAALVALAEDFSAQIVWATTWNHRADQVIAPLAGLPSGLAVLEMPEYRLGEDNTTWKLATVARWAEEHTDHQLVWFEDDLQDDARRWAAERGETLLVQPSPERGITHEQLEQVRAFLATSVASHV